jgi:CheY-like chemotaxis protein
MKKVMCGICQFPDINIKTLSKKISVNTSTISTSLQRLKEKDLVKKMYIPIFSNLNTSTVVVVSGKYRYQFPEDVRESVIRLVTQPSIPFLIASDNISWLVISLMPSAAQDPFIGQPVTQSEKFFEEMTFDVNKVLFDTKNSSVWRYFDYSPLLCKTLKIEPASPANSSQSLWSLDELKKNDKVIIRSLINNSEPSDFHRSQMLGISHPAISKIKRSLLEKGIIKNIMVPNLGEFGFLTFAWFNIKLDGKSVEDNLMANLCNYPNHILSQHDKDNIFILSVFSDMKDLMHGQQKIDEFMSNAMISYEDITFNYFSLENPGFTLKLNPIPATQNLVGVLKKPESEDSFSDPNQLLKQLLSNFFTPKEISIIMIEIKNSLNLVATNRNPLEIAMSMMLELLTEPKYLLSLETKERTALQAKLIEKLNSLRAEIENLDKFSARTTKKKVMVVEDSKPMVELLKDMFKSVNFQIVGVVDNGQGAFELYKDLYKSNNKPDVILMDIFIKGSNGVEATRLIREYDPHSNIVVLTSSLDNKMKSKMTSMEVDDYLIKPVTKMQLINCLEQAISKRRGLIN